MAKAPLKSDDRKVVKSTSYRIHRKASYEWQAFRTTVFSDQTVIEEACVKEDLLEIVMRKLGKIMKDEGEKDYLDRRSKLSLPEGSK